mgnify:CR=1 FL=1
MAEIATGPPAAPQLPRAVLLAMSEADIQRQAVEYAVLRRWGYYHTHDSRRSVAGFPDVVFVRERVVFAEFKSERGRLPGEQREWGALLERAGAEYHVWRPRDRNKILQVLF